MHRLHSQEQIDFQLRVQRNRWSKAGAYLLLVSVKLRSCCVGLFQFIFEVYSSLHVGSVLVFQ